MQNFRRSISREQRRCPLASGGALARPGRTGREGQPAHAAQRTSAGVRAIEWIARTISLGAVVALAGLGAPALAAAPERPMVNTGNARDVSYGSATLAGSLNPEGSNTSYYFQYGPTRAYGSQTGIADAGSGTQWTKVSLPIAGLQPITVYHYRLIAVNAVGTRIGSDRTLMTTKVPLSLQILAAPNPIPFGGTVTVQGTLSGTDNAARQVFLQANPFPFTAGFLTVGNPELTTATGSFSFPILGLTEGTQFRVVTNTLPPVISPVATESVTAKVSAHVRSTRRRRFARIYGTVTPAENGAQVGVLRIIRGRGVLVGGTVLRPRNAASSSFSRVVRVSPGVYRVLIRLVGGGVSSSYSTPLRIG